MQYGDQTNALTAAKSYGDPASTGSEKPLTLAITDAQDNALSIAIETRARLTQLRDRLFGTTPEALGNAAREPGFNGFGEAARIKGNFLIGVLHEIDALTSEINNRL